MPSSVRALDTFEDAFVSKHGAKAALVLLLPSMMDQGMCLLSMAYRRGLILRTVRRCHVVLDHCRGGMFRRGRRKKCAYEVANKGIPTSKIKLRTYLICYCLGKRVRDREARALAL